MSRAMDLFLMRLSNFFLMINLESDEKICIFGLWNFRLRVITAGLVSIKTSLRICFLCSFIIYGLEIVIADVKSLYVLGFV